MKFLKRIRSSLNRLLSPKPGKNGSSMAFVMIVGAVLVIWVLAIMPLMVAVGNNSLTLQGSYADYLGSRSAIEFCKGELEKMVESKPPYTFCVVKNVAQDGSYTYTAIPKMDSISLSTQYDNAINRDPDAVDNTIKDNVDTDDIPEENDLGKTVVAICAVQQRADETNIYDITITTYNNGHKSLTYSTVYTIRGSLLINPESYLKSQALPLSDFVVVDGKLGSNILWDSTIHSLSFSTSDANNVTNLNAIQENLKPYISIATPGGGYADSGVFPSVFKTPVYPAGGGSSEVPEVTEPTPTEPDYTDNKWTAPSPGADTGKKGDIWFVKNNDKIKVYLRVATTGRNQTTELNSNAYKLYLNGKEYGKNDRIPSSGSFRVSIDFYGSNNVLPAQGLYLGDIDSRMPTSHQDKPTGISLSVSGSTVTLSEVSGALYGYSDVNDPNNIIEWTSSNTFEDLDTSKAYYFFAYYPARVNNNTFYLASDVSHVGTVYSTSSVSTLVNGSSYFIMSGSHAMGLSGTTLKDNELSGIPGLSNGNYNSELIWTATENNGSWQFKNSNGKYLNMPFDTENEAFSLSVSDNATFFKAVPYGKIFTVYVTETVSDGCSTGTVYGALSYSDDFTATTTTSSPSPDDIYFVKVPALLPTPDVDQIEVPSFPALTDNSIYYGVNVKDHVRSELGLSNSTDFELYANGNITSGELEAGFYNIYAIVDGTYCYLDQITVMPAKLTPENTLQVTCTKVNSENKIIASVSGYHTQYGGNLWIGYRTAGSTDAYNWFQAGSDHTYTFILRYGTYEFIAYETGSKNYSSLTSEAVEATLAEPSNDAPEGGSQGGSGSDDGEASMMMGSSLYFMGRAGSINTEGTTIYLTTDLLVMRHGIIGDGKVYIYPYSNEQNYDESAADTLFFPVNDMKNAANFEFKACTFYWIPAGTDINHATADDLNFENRPPLSLNVDADYDQLKFLLRKGDYPEINMDIAYIDRENNADRVNANGTPNNEQLAHIVSGETIGWTNNGRMEDGDDRNSSNNSSLNNANSKFIVCAYVTSVKDAEIKRTANRIMLAAEETLEGGYESKTLRVTNNLHFTCRYISISADYIIQNGNNNYFKIKNLGQDKTFINLILDFFGINKYSSKTMQLEFEQSVRIQNKDGVLLSHEKSAGIYRIEHPDLDNDSDEGVNLFQTYTDPDSDYTASTLTVKYTNDEIKDLFKVLSFNSRFVERYVSIDAGNTKELEVSLIVQRTLSLYANYVTFENDIVSYKLSGWFSDGRIIINSQERGYESEYAGFFGGGSGESYNGTIIHIAPNDENSTREKNGIYVEGTFLPAGFYYIPASKDGTNINKLAEVADKEYGTIADIDKIHRINPAELHKYSIYIDPKTGAMSDAYVDTGLIGNGNLGESGFSGGNMG